MSFYRRRWYDVVGDILAYACLIEASGLLSLLVIFLGLLVYWIFS
jgi:hypothetical protein